MLIGNYSVLAKDPGRSLGGGAIGLGNNRGDFNKSSMARGAFCSQPWDYLSGVPDGYRPPYCWVLPRSAGGLSSRKNLAGVGALTSAIAGGKNATATLSGTGTLTGVGALIVSLVASLTGSGTITSAALLAYLQLAATLAGTGNLTGAASALAHAAAVLDGEGDVAGSTVLTALGTLAAQITVTGTGLTTANVGSAVWSALATANNTPGTMGEKLNGAASAGDPWGTALPGSYVSGTAGNIVGNLLSTMPDAVWSVASGTQTDETTLGYNLRFSGWQHPLPGAFGGGTAGALLGGVPTNVWAASAAANNSAGSMGEKVNLIESIDYGLVGSSAASAVWEEDQSLHTDPATFGGVLNGLVAAGDPWSMELPNGYAVGSAGYILGTLFDSLSVTIPPAVWQVIISNTKTAEQILRALAATEVGKISGIVAGAPTQTITIRDIDDTKNVVVATTDSVGNRTSITLDLDP